jgi:4-hydroxy-4-methyl-2-oxoglutarate aldolase
VLAPADLRGILQFDTCTIANAIEKMGVRLRNQGFTRPGLRPMTACFPRSLGYAATCKVRSADPPMSGRSYVERTDWWGDIERLPAPRIAVIQDLDAESNPGSCVGEVHAAILKAFGCAGVVTDGLVRDLPGVRRLRLPMFARGVSVSHSYAHMVGFGCAVEIFGLEIQSGDLLYADCHGAISIPPGIVRDLPGIASQIHEKERRIVDVCQSADFSSKELLEAIGSDA